MGVSVRVFQVGANVHIRADSKSLLADRIGTIEDRKFYEGRRTFYLVRVPPHNAMWFEDKEVRSVKSGL